MRMGITSHYADGEAPGARETTGARDETDEHVVIDPEMRRVYAELARVAATQLPVLVLGETGSGKEGAAEWLHQQSGRARARFVRVNCASLSESMVESELFGHERGAFTGAVAEREGYFAAAHGGTLLLDEVGELSLRVQAKLLRVLETGEIVRVGSTRPRQVDVRLVAATHRDLRMLVARGEFREDLYFRLDGLSVTVPSLRQRRSEILALAQLFLRRTARQFGRPPLGLSEAAEALLRDHLWPGNVRELRNAISRAVALCSGTVLDTEHFALASSPVLPVPSGPPDEPERDVAPGPRGGPNAGDMRGELRAFELARILAALERAGGNQTRAASLLGVSRRTLTNKLNAHRIARPRKDAKTGASTSGTRPAVSLGVRRVSGE